MHQLGCSGHSPDLTTDDGSKTSEEAELVADVVRDLAAAVLTRFFRPKPGHGA